MLGLDKTLSLPLSLPCRDATEKLEGTRLLCNQAVSPKHEVQSEFVRLKCTSECLRANVGAKTQRLLCLQVATGNYGWPLVTMAGHR